MTVFSSRSVLLISILTLFSTNILIIWQSSAYLDFDVNDVESVVERVTGFESRHSQVVKKDHYPYHYFMKDDLMLIAPNSPNIISRTTTSTRAAASNVRRLYAPPNATDCLPRGIHVAQASDVRLESSLDESRYESSQKLSGTVSMTLSFMLDYNTCPPNRVQPAVVLLGRRRGPLQTGTSASSSSTTTTSTLLWRDHGRIVVPGTNPIQFNYSSEFTNTSTGNIPFQSDWIYHVQLDNLVAGLDTYYYYIQVDAIDIARSSSSSTSSWRLRGVRALPGVIKTPTYPLVTPPLPGQPTTYAIVGDLGQTTNSLRTVSQIQMRTAAAAATSASSRSSSWFQHNNPYPISSIMLVGDLSYADQDPWRWQRWWHVVEPLLRSTPTQVLAGNHEIECDTENMMPFVAYEAYFRNPNRVGDNADVWAMDPNLRRHCRAIEDWIGHYQNGNSYYTYTNGLVQWVVLSSYVESQPGSIQYKWLERTLQSVNRTKTPWLWVAFHAPLYTTFEGHVNERPPSLMRQSMEPLFIQYGVNLVLCGHDHAYLRSHSMAHGQVDPTGQAPIYITIGTGGNREGPPDSYRNSKHPEPWIAQRHLTSLGYGLLYVPNATHALLNFVAHDTPEAEHGRQDHVWLVNSQILASSQQQVVM